MILLIFIIFSFDNVVFVLFFYEFEKQFP